MRGLQDQLTWIDWEAFERRGVWLGLCTQHGDLHCGNVIVGPYNAPVLIDFASVGEAVASLDSISLGLSVLLHPGSRTRSPDWPRIANLEHWDDVERFVDGCPVGSFVRATREWAARIAVGRREIYAIAYAIAIRQLKYPDPERNFVQALIRCTVEAFQRT